ncbi:MAG: M28 family peptidase [Longimicrobiales bacterium]
MFRNATRSLIGAAALLLSAFSLQDPLARALETIRARELRAHLYFLSHDRLEGRATASRGGAIAAAYIATQLMRAGAEPIQGTHLQPVPLIGVAAYAAGTTLSFGTPRGSLSARSGDDVVLWSQAETPQPESEGELVFVGYGVDAPEYDWNDFEGQDLTGKVVLVLVGDPPAPPEEPELFDGRRLTYFGRWNYKVEQAEQRGAVGVLLVHTPESAGYGWNVVRSSWTGEQLGLPRAAGAPPALAFRGWITWQHAHDVLGAAGADLDALHVAAARRDFRPVATGIRVRARVPSRVRRLQSVNVVGMLPGSAPDLRGEFVLFTAHYDHLGIGPPVQGDSIYNGAYDNASGVSVLLELADAFARLEPRPARSLVFLATTAEEDGLLGAEHYVRNPLVPIEQTVAVINIDGANLWGETNDIAALGASRSTLGRVLERRAAELGMRVVGDRAPELGFFFRSDHFPFARAGVPALLLQPGIDYRNRPPGWGARLLARYDRRDYHSPGDEYEAGFDLSGAVQQARLTAAVGYDVATDPRRPQPYRSPLR